MKTRKDSNSKRNEELQNQTDRRLNDETTTKVEHTKLGYTAE
jgi:hypothetical protein